VIKEASDLANENCRILIAMDQVKAWLLFNSQTKKLRKATNLKSAIFFMTAGNNKWKWKEKDVHHIASASERSNLQQVLKEMKTKIDALLK